MVQNTQQTTVTTRTSEQHAPLAQAKVMNKEAVVTNVAEKPILQNVIEKKNVEVHHKPVVQEIHEQKIIEIEKQPMMQNVVQPTIMQQERAATKYEEIGTGALGEREKRSLDQLHTVQAPKIVQQQGAVKQFQEQEAVAQVVKQEFVERHVQPVITEVREQNVVQEVLHPIVRKVHEAPIVREVQSAPLVQQQAPLQSGSFHKEQTLVQQQGLVGSQQNLTTTTTRGSGLSNTTTVTSGATSLEAERKNMNIHEQKVLNKDAPLSSAEKQNLAVHEQVVDNVVQRQSGLGSGNNLNQPVQTTTTTTGSNLHGKDLKHHDSSSLENEEKPGFMERVKEKLHIGHHKEKQ